MWLRRVPGRLPLGTSLRRSVAVDTAPRPQFVVAAPSPGWGPRGQGPSKNRQGPGNNNWTDHVPPRLPEKN